MHWLQSITRLFGTTRTPVRRTTAKSAKLRLDRFEDKITPTHFRYGVLSGHTHSATSNEVHFEFQQSWRRSYYGAPTVGQIIQTDNLNFGDNSSITMNVRVLSINTAEDYFVGELVSSNNTATATTGVTHTYAKAASWIAYMQSGNRISTSKNNADGAFRVEALVTTGIENDPPVSSLAPIVQVADNSIVQFQIPVADGDSDPVRYRFSTATEASGSSIGFTQPPGMSVSATGFVTWDISDTKVSTAPGDLWSTQIMVEDYTAATGVAKSRIALDFLLQVVAPTNKAPTLASNPTGPFTPTAGQNLTFTVTATDTDGTISALQALNPPTGMTVSTFTPSNSATGTVNVSWTPTQAQASSTYVITFQGTDNSGGTGTLQITISPNPNQPPNAVNDSYTLNQDTSITANVTDNDSDPENNAFSAQTVTTVSHGTLMFNTTGAFTYVPAAKYFGSDSFTYKLSDSFGTSKNATVTLNVAAVNAAPTASSASVTTNEDTAVTVTLSATDPNNDTLTFAVGSVAHGTLTPLGGATYRYTPTADYNGPDSFTFTASDGKLSSNTATVSLTVAPVNDPPVLATPIAATTAEDTSVSFTVSATDIDSSSVTFTVGAAGHGTVTVTGSTITYTPAKDYNGSDSFTVTANDGSGGTATATANITVTPVNDPPVIATPISKTTPEDTSVSFTVSATDIDSSSVTFTVGTAGHGTVSVSGNTVTYIPAADYNGPDSFVVTANDGSGGTATATANITVTPVNDPPVIATPISKTTPEDTSVSFTVSATDVDSSSVTFTVGAAGHGTVTVTGSTITYTPAANYNGSDSFTVTANDGNGGTATATANITVTPVNDPPVLATPIAATTPEDTSVSFTVSATDIDSSSVTFTVGTAGHGTVTVTGGTITYTPALNYNGSDSFTVTANDGNGGTATATANVTVTPVNDPPVIATPIIATTPEDTSVSFTVSATDVDSSSITWTVGTAGHGTVSVTGNTVTYTPAKDYNGSDSFTVTANDGSGGVVSATANVTVTPVNDPPVIATPISKTTPEDTSVSFTVSATDVDSSSVTFTVGTAGHGTVSIVGNTITYTPAADYNGSDSFTVTANDGSGGTATATANITVTPVNDPPVLATPIAATTPEDTSVSFTVSATDIDSSSVTFTVGAAGHGTVSVVGNTITYTPAANYNGSDSFTVTANDGSGGTATATANVTITPVNDPPVLATPIAATTAEDTSVSFTVSATDVDSNSVTFTVGAAGHGTVTVTGSTITYTPAADYNGSDSFTVTANDGNGGTATATANVTVTPVNDPPITSPFSITTVEDTAATLTLTATDVDSTTFFWSVTGSPTHGSAVVSGSVVTYTPSPDYNGPDSFIVTVSDGAGGSATAAVSVNVTPGNDAPTVTPATGSTNEDTAATITVSGTDPDNDPLTYSVVSPPSHGTVTVSGATFVYTPAKDYSGSDSFTYAANDGKLSSTPAAVTLTVAAVADAPSLTVSGASGNEGAAIPLSISAAVTDTDGSESITQIVLSGLPSGAVLNKGSSLGGGAWKLAPADLSGLTATFADNGSYTIGVVATSQEASNSSTASTTGSLVAAVSNVAPTLTATGAVTVDEGSPYTLTLGAVSDPGTDTVASYTINWGDGVTQTVNAGSLPPSRQVLHTYADGAKGGTGAVVTVGLTDDDSTFPSLATVGLTVQNVAPTVNAGGAAALVNGQKFTRAGTYTDPGANDAPFTGSVNYGDGKGSQTIAVTGGAFNLSYSYGKPGSYTATVTVTDKDGASGITTVPVTVNAAAGVESVVIPGDGQHSMIRYIVVNFVTAVTLQPGAVVVQSIPPTGSGGTPVTFTSNVTTATSGGRTSATVTFTGPSLIGGSLPDGNFSITVLAAKVSGAGITATDYVDNTQWRLFGDINGDRQTDAVDQAILTPVLRTRPPTAAYANTGTYFDYDTNSYVDPTIDNAQFQARFKKRLNLDGSYTNLP